MNRKQKTEKEHSVERRKNHLDRLVEITALNQLSVGDILLALYKEQLPDLANVGHYHWDWSIGSSVRVVEKITQNEIYLVGLGDHTHDKHYYSWDENSQNSGIEKLYKAHPFHLALGMTEAYINSIRKGREIVLMPGIPKGNDCDSILLRVMSTYLDFIFPAFDGFKDFETCMSFHKAFRSWDVTENPTIDSIIWSAINGSTLFNYFYDELVLVQFDEWKNKG